MTSKRALRILCVDDEPDGLEVLAELIRELRPEVEVSTASEPMAALATLERDGPFDAVISDLRMRGLDGVALLRRARELAPDTVRVLLTGYADLGAAVAAINEGGVFRFLTKPYKPEGLIEAVDAALELHRLITCERVLLEQTLHGSIKALTDVLALAHPTAFGRASRVTQYVVQMLDELGERERWPIEVAAMLSQIACVSLPGEVVSKLYHGRPLSAREKDMVARLPETTDAILANIPRIEPVREILRQREARFDGAESPRGPRGEGIPLGARLLKLASDLAALEAAGTDASAALARLCSRTGWYDLRLLELLARVRGMAASQERCVALPVSKLRAGMVLEEDVFTPSGKLILAAGIEVTCGLLARLLSFAENAQVKEPIRVRLPASSPPEPAGGSAEASTPSR